MFRNFLLAGLLVVPCVGESIAVNLAPSDVVMKRLAAGLVSTQRRQSAIKKLFEEVGCQVVEQPIDKHHGNVICTLPGASASEIVIGGHFDYVDRGKGIVDDWSGASLLPSLYQALKAAPRQHTYVFVAFTGEERGLLGSNYFVKKLPEQEKRSIRAFLNLECLGLTSPKVWVHRSNPELVTRLRQVAQSINIPVQGVDVDKVGDDDTHPFLNARIPVITLHSVTQETLRVLHSERDRMEAVSREDYYSAYKLTACYLAFLDAKTE